VKFSKKKGIILLSTVKFSKKEGIICFRINMGDTSMK